MSPKKHAAQEVFTPGSYPELTYVQRQSGAERDLKDALSVKGQIISVIGPSKSGKTVLVENVVGRDNLIAVSGAVLRTPEDLWSRILDWMDFPSNQSTALEKSTKKSAGVEAGAGFSIPLFVDAKGKATGGLESGDKETNQ